MVCLRGCLRQHACCLRIHPDGTIAEDRHPEQVEDSRDQQDTDDEFADRAPAGNLGDEQADERCPGNPPGSVHDGPAREPLFLGALIGKGAEGQLYDVRQVVADVLGKRRPR